jgi:hypothetical protein
MRGKLVETGPNMDLIIKSRDDMTKVPKIQHSVKGYSFTVINHEDFLGKKLLIDIDQDVQRFQDQIAMILQDHHGKIDNNPTCLKFLMSFLIKKSEEVFTQTAIGISI